MPTPTCHNVEIESEGGSVERVAILDDDIKALRSPLPLAYVSSYSRLRSQRLIEESGRLTDRGRAVLRALERRDARVEGKR